MFAQYIKLKGWNVLLYYNVDEQDFVEIEDSLRQVECSKRDIKKAFKVLQRENTGFTFSNTDYKMSIVCVSKATTAGEFVNTCVHEAKHVLSHICQYYDIDEDSEKAAYIIGYLVHEMYKMVARIIKNYVRFIGQ